MAGKPTCFFVQKTPSKSAKPELSARLARRGVAPAAGLVGSALDAELASAAVSPRLINAMVSRLGRAATARAVAGTGVSIAVRELADGLIRTMVLAKLKLAASVVAAGAIVMILGTSLVAISPRSVARDGQETHAGSAAPRREITESAEIPHASRAVSSIDLRVVDRRTNEPLAGVAVTIKIDRKDSGHSMTDKAGRAAVAVPSPLPNYLAVGVSKDGFASMTSFIRRPVIQGGDIPASYTLAMYPVETVAGVVRDDQGRPIAGVLVKPRMWTRGGAGRADREEFERLPSVRTDAQGHWKCESMPAGIESRRVSFGFSHDDYQRVELPPGNALELIKRGEVTVLPRGWAIQGRIIDTASRPIPGALIGWTSQQSMGSNPRATADADGRFRFLNVPVGQVTLRVEAPGYAPDMMHVWVAADLAPVEFRLEKGRTIRGRVIDRQGKPLAQATVFGNSSRNGRDWQTRTGDDGEFHLDHVTSDSVAIRCSRNGYLGINLREVPPGVNEVSITLVKHLKVRGTVVDAGTRHAIKSFTLVTGRESAEGISTVWDHGHSRKLSRGRYEIEIDGVQSQGGRRLRIEADGYISGISRVIHDDEDEPVVNFVLHKG